MGKNKVVEEKYRGEKPHTQYWKTEKHTTNWQEKEQESSSPQVYKHSFLFKPTDFETISSSITTEDKRGVKEQR